MRKRDVEVIRQLLRQFIDDVERGKPIEESGWLEVNHSVEKALKTSGLLERSDEGARVSIHSPLPEELLKTEEGELFSDMVSAIRIRELVPRLAEDQSLRTGVEISGFVYMLEASEFPVLSHRLFEQGFSSADEWHTCALSAVPLLTLLAARRVWGVESIEDVLNPLRHSSLPAPETQESEGEDSNRVRRVLKWDQVLDIIDPETCKVMGFLWYIDRLTILQGIRYPESMVLVQERAWRLFEKETRRPIGELRNKIMGDVDLVERETLDGGYAIACWHEILRLPW